MSTARSTRRLDAICKSIIPTSFDVSNLSICTFVRKQTTSLRERCVHCKGLVYFSPPGAQLPTLQGTRVRQSLTLAGVRPESTFSLYWSPVREFSLSRTGTVCSIHRLTSYIHH